MRIEIQNAKPGMLLADDVILPDGTGCVEKAKPLTNETIIQMTLAGVTRLTILDPDQSRAPGGPAAPRPAESPAPSAVPEKIPAPAGGKPSVPAVPPQIKVVIAPDSMSAKIGIEPATGGTPSQELTTEILTGILKENGVIHGINDSRLLEITLRWSALKEPSEFDNVAQGTPPTPGKEGPCHFTVPHITNSRELEVVRKARRYWEAAKYVPNLHRVSKDAIIAEKRFETPPQPGANVKGEPVQSQEPPEELHSLEAGAMLSKDGKNIIAEINGIAYGIDRKVGVASLDFLFELEMYRREGACIARSRVRFACVSASTAEGRKTDVYSPRRSILAVRLVRNRTLRRVCEKDDRNIAVYQGYISGGRPKIELASGRIRKVLQRLRIH